jgi:hypothetical protein
MPTDGGGRLGSRHTVQERPAVALRWSGISELSHSGQPLSSGFAAIWAAAIGRWGLSTVTSCGRDVSAERSSALSKVSRLLPVCLT